MRRSKIAFALIIWFGCGYFASAMWTAKFFGDYGGKEHYNVETRGSAARGSLLLFFLGPMGAASAVITCQYYPMWDWPKYLFSDYRTAGEN
jgi:hypothetical protein